jgi:hypothetical protein
MAASQTGQAIRSGTANGRTQVAALQTGQAAPAEGVLRLSGEQAAKTAAERAKLFKPAGDATSLSASKARAAQALTARQMPASEVQATPRQEGSDDTSQ